MTGRKNLRSGADMMLKGARNHARRGHGRLCKRASTSSDCWAGAAQLVVVRQSWVDDGRRSLAARERND